MARAKGEHEYLKLSDAPRSGLIRLNTRSLGKIQWAGALDSVGGTMLAGLVDAQHVARWRHSRLRATLIKFSVPVNNCIAY